MGAMDYWRFDPSLCGFPTARLPFLPQPSSLTRLLTRSPQTSKKSFRRIDANVSTLFYTRARYALLEAYRRAGVGPGGALMAPSYHCRTMLDPAIQLEAPILLFELDERLRPRLDRLAACLAQYRHPVKALLLPHFFGFAQAELSELRDFSIAHGLALIEDCSHLLLTTSDAPSSLGHTGHWTVASPYKIFACGEGGLLWGQDIGADSTAPSLCKRPAREWRALIRTMASARRYRPISEAGPVGQALQAARGIPIPQNADGIIADGGLSEGFAPEEAHVRGSPWALRLMKNDCIQRASLERRRHYQRLLDVVVTLPHCRPLFGSLPPVTAPYVFPLLLEHADPHFFLLKRLGVPIGRWDELAISECRVAQDYRSRLIHLPCHQGLSSADLEWICEALVQTLRLPVERVT